MSDMSRAEELSAAYADARLELLRPDIAATSYTRGRKMSLDLFDGSEVESAYEVGYEQAEKDLMEKAGRWLKDNAHIFGYAECTDAFDAHYIYNTDRLVENFKQAMSK